MMKKIMIAAMMATTVIGAMPAAAQEGGWRGNGDRRAGENRGGENRAPENRGAENGRFTPGAGRDNRWRNGGATAPAPVRPAPSVQPGRPGIAVGEPNPNRNWQKRRDDRRDWRQDNRDARQDWRQDRRDDRRDWRSDRRDDRRDWRQDHRDDRRDWRQDRRDDRRDWRNDRRYDWNNNWRNDRRYNWHDFRHRNADRYRARPYYAPRGWDRGYSRFSIGISIGSPFYDRSYWIDNPYRYRLPPAHGPLRWIRYYDDAMLIDIRDGYVVDVIYDFFW